MPSEVVVIGGGGKCNLTHDGPMGSGITVTNFQPDPFTTLSPWH